MTVANEDYLTRAVVGDAIELPMGVSKSRLLFMAVAIALSAFIAAGVLRHALRQPAAGLTVSRSVPQAAGGTATVADERASAATAPATAASASQGQGHPPLARPLAQASAPAGAESDKATSAARATLPAIAAKESTASRIAPLPVPLPVGSPVSGNPSPQAPSTRPSIPRAAPAKAQTPANTRDADQSDQGLMAFDSSAAPTPATTGHKDYLTSSDSGAPQRGRVTSQEPSQGAAAATRNPPRLVGPISDRPAGAVLAK